jgi:hypothetical protein
MKKVAIILALAALVGAQAVPADAFVAVTALIEKEKDVFVDERITKTKTVTITVDMLKVAVGAAEAQALSNQINAVNFSGPFQEGDISMLLEKHVSIVDSVNSNTGIVGVNQDAGNTVNQANVVALALTNSQTAVTNAQAEASQFTVFNRSVHEELTVDLSGDLTSTIVRSVNGNAGIVGVNQNVGNSNNQTNTVALAVGIGSLFALSEAALGQVNVGNHVHEISTVKYNTIVDSVNGNTGIVGVNQATGHMNNQASAVSVAAMTSTVALTVPFSQ